MPRILRALAFVVLSPIWLLLGMLSLFSLLVIAIPVSIRGSIRHRRWIRALRSSGRVRTVSQLLEANEQGTLIVDQPGWGGKHRSCWWTPDDLESISPMGITPLADRIDAFQFGRRGDPAEESFDRWVYHRYLSDTSGTAYLVSTRKGRQVARTLSEHLAGMKTVETWSAPYSDFGPSTDEKQCTGEPVGRAKPPMNEL